MQICPAGYYCTSSGADALPCPPGSYCMAGSKQPKQCQAGFVCAGNASSVQVLCPQGGYCPAGSAVAKPCPVAFFCPNGSSTPKQCPVYGFCPTPGLPNFYNCSVGTWSVPGTTSCSRCAAGWFPSSNTCAQCNGWSWKPWLFLVTFVSVGLAIIIKGPSNIMQAVYIRVCSAFFISTGMLSFMAFSLPLLAARMFQLYNSASISVSAVNPECLDHSWDFTRVLVTLVVLGSVLGVLLIRFAVAYWWQRNDKDQRKIASLIVLVIIQAYAEVVRLLLDFFPCERMLNNDYQLVEDITISCEDSVFHTRVILAAIGVFIVAVGPPLGIYLAIMKSARLRMHPAFAPLQLVYRQDGYPYWDAGTLSCLLLLRSV